jgi:hypothetical protein
MNNILTESKPNRNRIIKELLWLSLYLFILIPPILVRPVASGLDSSWQITVNLATYHKLIFGEEYIFTLGPLGFLITKNAVELNKWLVVVFEGFLIGCILYAIRSFLRPLQYRMVYSIVTALVVLLISAGSCDVILIFSYLYFSLVFLKNGQWKMLLPVILLSALSFFIKVNYGIIMVVFFYTTLAVAWIKNKITFNTIFPLLLANVLIIVLLSGLYRVSIFLYLKSSLHIINAYNDAMYIPAGFFDLYPILAFLLVGIFLLGFLMKLLYYKNNLIALYNYFLCGFILFLMFKNGFVRADGHRNVFFANCSLVFASMVAFSETWNKELWKKIFCVAIVISYAVLIINPLHDAESGLNKETILNKLSISEYLNDLTSFL